MKINFPAGFLWGAATSAHQVEGGCLNNWSEWEKKNAHRLASEVNSKWQDWQKRQFPEMFYTDNYISGRACDHYHLYEKDFDMSKELGHNAHRFSIEWSRVEPEEGKFDEGEIEHYRKVLQALRDRELKPFITLWHWTNPLWLEKQGGVMAKDFEKHFSRYAQRMASAFGDLVDFWITINEPMSVIPNCYVKGIWTPQKKNPFLALRAYRKLSEAHIAGYHAIHSVKPGCKVGFANIMAYNEPLNGKSLLDNMVVSIADHFGNRKFLQMTKGHNDFLALQYYFHNRLSFFSGRQNENQKISDLGWELYPEGIYHLLKELAMYKLPIYVTENGLADAKDNNRTWFIQESLKWTHRAIQEGVDVRGYFYWSLLDNFEWDKGFWPRFGLVEVDYETMERKIRPSAWAYAKICKTNSLEVD